MTWLDMWGSIGLAHFLAVGRGPGLQLPPKWAAIALGFDFDKHDPADVDAWHTRVLVWQRAVNA